MTEWLLSWLHQLINSPFLLEMLNGGAVTPELIWAVIVAHYLSIEARRRGLHWFDWFNLPPSMDLMLAIFICDVGVWLRSITIWVWRRTGAPTDFTGTETMLLVIGGSLIVIGYLCKIRALTHPDLGNRPWLISAAVSGAVIFLLVVLH